MSLNTFFSLFWGALTTVKISAMSILLGGAIGLLMGIFSSQQGKIPYLNGFIKGYVTLMRGTPLFIQLLFLYFAVPEITKGSLTPFTAGVLALGCNSAAYLAEIIRGGINSLPKGQWEAGFSLGYKKNQVLYHLIFPQLFRNTLPAITNEFISLIKESSILMILGVQELTKMSRDIVSRELRPFEIYSLTALIYLTMTTSLSFLAKKLERRSS